MNYDQMKEEMLKRAEELFNKHFGVLGVEEIVKKYAIRDVAHALAFAYMDGQKDGLDSWRNSLKRKAE